MSTTFQPRFVDSTLTRRQLLREAVAYGLLAAGCTQGTTHARSEVSPKDTPVALGAPGRRIAAPSIQIELSPARPVPTEVQVPAGASVTWLNCGTDWMSVSALDGSFASGPIAPGETFAHRCTRPGWITYVCENHPIRDMTGRIGVQ